MTREEAERIAREGARNMVEKLRASNAAYAAETGEPSDVSDADYARVEDELFAELIKHWHPREATA